MANKTERFQFPNTEGTPLAGRLELPLGEPHTYVLFAHCFTCTKDIAAATRISRALTDHGAAVLRFDFTGLGNSDGDFANTNFTSNVNDLIAAANHLRSEYKAPEIIIGHSLGGAAVLAAAGDIPEIKAVVTVAAPSDAAHVQHLFQNNIDEIEAKGAADVDLAGRKFTIKKQFIDDINKVSLTEKIGQLGRALLIFHSPQDQTVSIDHAANIYMAAKHPKSFVTLDGADHLLTRLSDADYVASMIASWVQKYLNLSDEVQKPKSLKSGEVWVQNRPGKWFTHDIFTKDHHVVADEPEGIGLHLGMNPYEYLLAGLGACTAMTLRMYANHKKINLESVQIKLTNEKIHAKDCEDCETKVGKIDFIEKEIRVQGDLTEEQKQKLLEIADKCPVHRTLHSEVKVQSRLID